MAPTITSIELTDVEYTLDDVGPGRSGFSMVYSPGERLPVVKRRV